jgi:hypothetical protein
VVQLHETSTWVPDSKKAKGKRWFSSKYTFLESVACNSVRQFSFLILEIKALVSSNSIFTLLQLIA